MATNFVSRDLNLTKRESNVYTTNVGKLQRFGEFLHGGFVTSLLAHTALEHAQTTLDRKTEQHLVAVQVQFLKPTSKDEIELRVEELRVGKDSATLLVTLSQKQKARVTANVNIIDAPSSKRITLDTQYNLHPPPHPVDLSKLAQNADPRWVKVHFPYNEASLTIPKFHWNTYFMASGSAHPRIQDMWMEIAHPGERITTITLPTLMDDFARHTANWEKRKDDFSYNAVLAKAKRGRDGETRQEDLDDAEYLTWTLTQGFNLEIVRQLPPEGVRFVFLRAEAKSIRDGRLVCELTVLDEEEEVVAIGSCTDLLVPTEKWAKKQRKKNEETGFEKRIMKI